jgi:integrase
MVRSSSCEVLGFRWSDVDLDAGHLFVRQAAAFVGREVTFDRPKSRDSERSVPLTSEVVRVLPEARAEQASRRLSIGEGWRDLGLVVDNGYGSGMHPERLSRYFRRLVRAPRHPGSAPRPATCSRHRSASGRRSDADRVRGGGPQLGGIHGPAVRASATRTIERRRRRDVAGVLARSGLMLRR